MNISTAERSALGGMMLSKAAAYEVIEQLEPGDFADERHGTIFRTIAAQLLVGAPVDPITVGDALAVQGELARVGGAALLHELTSEVPTASNAGYYASMIRSAATRRSLVVAGQHIADRGNATEGDADELVEAARTELDAIVRSKLELRPIGDGFAELRASLEATPRFVASPWPSLDKLIDGFRPGALTVIGARPGSGKSLMGLQIADALAARGPVALASLEMHKSELTKRMLAFKGSILMSSLTRSRLGVTDWAKIDDLEHAIARMPLFIDDRSELTMSQIRSFAKSVSRKGELQGVVVDYLQLISSVRGDKRPRWEVVGEITRGLKIMARELDVPVIALCQLNRQSEGNIRPPTLGDLRESGSIEQDADVVLLLQRGWDETLEKANDDLDVHVAKNRHGMTGKVTLFWEGHYARVGEMPW